MVPVLSPASGSPGQIPSKGGTHCARIARDWCAWCQMLRENLYYNYWGQQVLSWAFIYSCRAQKAVRVTPVADPEIPGCILSLMALASWAFSQISLQHKWIWWADLRLFPVPLVLDNDRLLFQVLWFLAAASGFLTLASALFLPLKLSNWHTGSQTPSILDKGLNYLLLTSRYKLGSLCLCGGEWKLTLYWLLKKAWNTNRSWCYEHDAI